MLRETKPCRIFDVVGLLGVFLLAGTRSSLSRRLNYFLLYMLLSCVFVAGNLHANVSQASSASSNHSQTDRSSNTAAAKPSSGELNDLRVLIDISGSMKTNDPHNLRVPALDLLVRLLPHNTRAGVWLFGETVTPLLPLRLADESWKKTSVEALSRIRSDAPYTNIGAALERALDAPTQLNNADKHIILLTDGMVDVAKDRNVNTQERQRILQQLLPLLRDGNYRIHTIALSKNADAQLLQAISQVTDGIFATAETADELTPIFLRIFNQFAKQDLIPIQGDKFAVDASIEEFTALIFRPENRSATQLKTPSGDLLESTHSLPNIKWFRAEHYDLVTVMNPEVGDWEILTGAATNSRVSVISNFKLKVEPLRTQITADTQVDVEFHFEENGKRLVSGDFLEVLETQIAIGEAGDLHTLAKIAGRDISPQGFYYFRLPPLAPLKQATLRLVVDGKTFQREYVHEFQLNPTFFSSDYEFEVVKTGDRANRVTVRLLDDEFQLIKIAVNISLNGRWLKDVNGKVDAQPSESTQAVLEWLSDLPGNYAVDVVIEAKNSQGVVYRESLPKIEYLVAAPSVVNSVNEITKPKHSGAYIEWLVGGILSFLIAAIGVYLARRKNKAASLASTAPVVTPAVDEIPALTDVYELPPMNHTINSYSKQYPLDDLAQIDETRISVDISDESLDDKLIDEMLFPLDDLSDTDFDEPKDIK
ncbi:MAG: VWA domain-containing protein [Cellvibrio sp.]